MLLALSVMIVLLPILRNFQNWGSRDWDLHAFYHAVPRLTILEYRQIPLWNPYHCGGSPLLGHPQSYFLSPFFFIILIFGIVPGIKLLIIFLSIIGIGGMYRLARAFSLNVAPAIFSSFIFMFNSMFSLSIASGMLNFLTIALIPWIFLCFIKSLNDIRYVFLSAFLCVLIFFGGGVHVLIITLTFIVIYSLFSIICRYSRLKSTTLAIILLLLLTLLLGAVKFFPSLEFTDRYPRLVKDYSGYSLQSLYFNLFSRDQLFTALDGVSKMKGFVRGVSWGMDENGMYLGFIPGIFFIIGFIRSFKRHLPLALILLVLLWICFGNRITPSLWGLIRHLPIYNLQRVATRYRFVLILCVAIFAGFGLQFFGDFLSRRRVGKKVIMAVVIFITGIIFYDFALVNGPIWKEAFPVYPPLISQEEKFHQKFQGPAYNREGEITDAGVPEGSSYYNFLVNAGTIDAYEPVPVPARAVPSASGKFRGEIFLAGSEGKAIIEKWSPNRMVINAELKQRGMVVINQNYFPGWIVKGAGELKIEAVEGLLGVRLPPGKNRIVICYLPTSFIVGFVVSGVTFIAGLLIFILLSRRTTLKRRILHGSSPV